MNIGNKEFIKSLLSCLVYYNRIFGNIFLSLNVEYGIVTVIKIILMVVYNKHGKGQC